MLTHRHFLLQVQDSFKRFIESGTSRSTAKFKPLHGAIAADLAHMLGKEYTVVSQGFEEGKEAVIKGRYLDKRVDITVQRADKGEPVAGIGVKFIMQNYSQNSNDYFENMLGETANIRSARVPYFQVFIILDRLPYYKKTGELSRWEDLTQHNMAKYCRLAEDNTDIFAHTPNKTLICVSHVTPEADEVHTKREYLGFYKKRTRDICVTVSENRYPELKADGTVILNDYPEFMEKVFHTIKAL